MRILKWLDDWFEQAVLVVLCTILVACLSYSAIVRYFLSHPYLTGLSHKAEELAIFAFVFQLYFGSVLATKERSHFRVSAQFDWMRPPFRRWRFVIGDIFWLAFNVFVVWQGLLLVQSAFERPEPSMALRIPMQWIYLIIPLAFALTSFRLIQTYMRPEPDEDDPLKKQL